MTAHNEHHIASPRTYFLTFGALLLLLAATVAASSIQHATLGIVVALIIAVVKAGLIAMIFMHLWWSSPLVRVFAFAGLLWLAILFTLTWSDYFTRGDAAYSPEAPVEFSIEADRRH